VDRILSEPLSQPYKILGITEDASKEQVKRAFAKLAKALHLDKNKELLALEAFRSKSKSSQYYSMLMLVISEVRQAYVALIAKSESFAENGFKSDFDPSDRTDHEETKGEIDRDSNIPMQDAMGEADVHPIPTLEHEKIYAQSTPYIYRLFDNRDNKEALSKLKEANKKIERLNFENGGTKLQKLNFKITYQGLTSRIFAAESIAKIFGKSSSKREQAKCQQNMRDINDRICKWVKGSHFPKD
jgi:curved DNA-binding protein CbpA